MIVICEYLVVKLLIVLFHYLHFGNSGGEGGITHVRKVELKIGKSFSCISILFLYYLFIFINVFIKGRSQTLVRGV